MHDDDTNISSLEDSLVLDFRYFAPFRNGGDSNENVVENRGQISHFLTPVKIKVGMSKISK